VADTPSSSSSRGFNWKNPGAKEFLIIGGVALVAGYLYFRRQAASQQAAAQQAASTAAAPAASTTPAAQPQVVYQGSGSSGSSTPGTSWQSLKNALSNQQSSATTSSSSAAYQYVPSETEAAQLMAQGTQLYYQSSPGVYAPYSTGMTNLPNQGALYVKTPSSSTA
jgi:hypothetical protein